MGEAEGAVVLGDAAELAVLREAGLDDASSVLVTTHDDDVNVNVYLTLYCRKLRPDIQVLSLPPALAGRTLAESAVRQETSCSVIAVCRDGETVANPDVHAPLDAGAELVQIGDTEAEHRFLKRYAS